MIKRLLLKKSLLHQSLLLLQPLMLHFFGFCPLGFMLLNCSKSNFPTKRKIRALVWNEDRVNDLQNGEERDLEEVMSGS